MAYTPTRPRMPFNGRASVARHNSFKAAIVAGKAIEQKRARYLTWLIRKGKATDQGAEEALGFPLQSICSIRNSLADQGLVKAIGSQIGRYGVPVTIWAPAGWAAKLRRERKAARTRKRAA